MGRKHAIVKPARRAAHLKELRILKMARSAHAYVRGNTVQFYDWLDRSDASLPHGPPVWICGDCHVSNLGPIANSEGEIEVQIRDLDQTVIGNPAHDLIRLAVSLAMAARSSDLPGVITAKVVEQLIVGYGRALLEPAMFPSKPATIKVVMKRAAGRTWKHLANERIDGTDPKIPLSKNYWPITAQERAEITALMGSEPIRRLATALNSRDDEAKVELLDATYWVKGCSSLGLLRFAVLLRVGKTENSETGLCLLDIKEAVRSAAPRAPRARVPRDNAKRIVEGASHLAPHLGERMLAGKVMGRSVFVRELLPQDLKIELDRLDAGEVQEIARYLGAVVGRAHAAQMTPGQRASWLSELERNQPATLDAPSWLWRSVVELVQSHEGGYLEHCRLFANSHSSKS